MVNRGFTVVLQGHRQLSGSLWEGGRRLAVNSMTSWARAISICCLPRGRGWSKMGAYGSKRFRADLQALKDNDPTLQVSDKSLEPQAAVATY